MTPEHHSLLMLLGGHGRLGPFCPFPLPDGYTGDATITPRTTKLGREVDLPELGPRPQLADPFFVVKNWRLLVERDARLAELTAAEFPPCPHCGSDDVSRGATGLDQCRACSGLFRDGKTLGRAAADGVGPRSPVRFER